LAAKLQQLTADSEADVRYWLYVAASNEGFNPSGEQVDRPEPPPDIADLREIRSSDAVTHSSSEPTFADPGPISHAALRYARPGSEHAFAPALTWNKPRRRQLGAGATIAASAAICALIVAPYLLITDRKTAFMVSMVCATCSTFVVGYVDGRMTDRAPFWRGLWAVFIGAIATAAVYTIGQSLWVGR
jgi:VIT1/CCC1 family predicted Fe2+/Mn2+ transporter